VASGDFNRGGLKIEEGVAEIRWQREFRKPSPGFLCQVVRHLYIYIIWRDEIGSGPALFDHLNKFLGDIEAPVVGPAVLEPLGQLGSGVVIENVHV
jgi:hypothetical protein